MNKIITIIVVLVVIIGGYFALKGGEIQNKEQIKLGVILPLTGDFAVIGEELKRGIDIEVGRLQERRVDIVAIYEDDKFDPREAATAANKLISVDKIDFAMVFSVEEARPVAPIFNNAKVPLVATWDSNQFLKDAGPYVFSNGFSTEKSGEIMADFAYNKLGLKNIAVIAHIDAYAEIISKSFEDRFVDNGGKIVYNDAVQVGTTDFRLHISKIKSAKPDAVYFPIIPFDSVSFLKQAKETGLNVPLLSVDGLIQEVIDAAGSAAENIYFTNVYIESPEFPDLYKQKYGEESYGITYVASGYEALKKIGEQFPTSDLKATLDQVFGPTRSADRIEKIYQVKNGVPVEVK